MVLPPTRLMAFWRHSMKSFVIWSQRIFSVPAYQIHCTITVNIACRATFDSYHTEFLLHRCWDIMSGISCKALQSNPLLAGKILQYKTGVTLAASKQHTFQIFQSFTFVCQILPQGRSSRTQSGRSVRLSYDVLLWGKNDSSLEGDASHLQSLPHRFTDDGRCIPAVYYSNG